MRFTTVLAPLGILAGLAAGQTAIINAIETIEVDIAAFGAAFSPVFDAATVTATGEDLIDSLVAAVAVVQASPKLSIFQTAAIAGSFDGLDETAQEALAAVAAGKAAIDGLGITVAVRDLLVQQRESVAALGAAIVPKVPSIVRGNVADGVADIDAEFASVVAIYS